MGFFIRVFPFLGWFKGLKFASLRSDFVAGLTVALVLIPQSMAYAQLAGLPAYYGLYAAFLPPMIASLFGSSRQLATGPVAVVSLMTAAALEPIATAGTTEFITYAILLAFLVGVFQFLLGILRLGLVVNFLSHPVVNGFTCAAALIIATSQLPKIFGVFVDKASHHYETVGRVLAAAFYYTHLPTLFMAVFAFAVMISLKKLNPKIPNVLVAVALTTLLSAIFGLQNDRSVTLDRIRSDGFHAKVSDFKKIVNERLKSESLRTDSNKKLNATDGDRVTCARCHTERNILDLAQPKREGGSTDGLAAIHHLAGLLDDYTDEVRRQESELRGELRDFHLEAVEEEGGTVYYPYGEIPEGKAGDGRRWRVKVGRTPLDPGGVTLMGGGAVVGVIPEGLPKISIPPVGSHLSTLLGLIPAAIIISLLGFMEAISIAKAMAARTRQKLDPNQELIGQGLANIVGCCGQSYACSGSFSRSAVNLQAGAVTGLSNVFSSAVVVVVLLFMTPLLYHLPQAVLAAIIMMAVVGLLNVSGFVHAWQVRKFDGITGVVSFVATLLFAPHLEYGIFLGVALALGGYLFRTMRPKVAVLSPHTDGSLQDSGRYKLRECRHLSVIRFDGPLNFASVNYMEDGVLSRVAGMSDLKHVLIDAMGINEIDASGEEMLRHLMERLRSAGYQVSFSGLKDEVMDALRRAHLDELIGKKHFFPTKAHAVAAIYAGAHVDSNETDCPFRKLMPRTTELSLHPDGSLRDAAHRGLPLCRRIAIFRFDDPLNFANTSFLEEELIKLVADRPHLQNLVFAAQGITEMDLSAAEKLGSLVERLRADGYEISFCSFKDNVLELLERSGVAEKIGRDHIFPTQVQAVSAIHGRAHRGSSEENCPLLPMLPRVAELSLHPDGAYRDANRHGLALCSRIVAIRFDGPLDRGSVEYFVEEVNQSVRRRPNAHHVMVAAHAISWIDHQAVHKLAALVEDLRGRGYRVCFSGLTDDVVDVLQKGNAYRTIGVANMFATQVAAVSAIHAESHQDAQETRCPLREAVSRD